MSTYYQRNREKKLAYQRAYYRRNREKKLQQSAEWDDRNRERARERWRRYRRNNPQVRQTWLEKNKESRRVQKRAYDRTNARKLSEKLGVSIPEARWILNEISIKRLSHVVESRRRAAHTLPPSSPPF